MSTIIQMKERLLPNDCYIYKHSTTCPISARAGQEVKALQSDLPIYWVNVREQRDLSNWIAETFGVVHESPQLILIQDGKPQKVWSHYEISRDILR